MVPPPVGRLASWMYEHPTSYVMVVCLLVAVLLAEVGAFAWAVAVYG